MMLCHCHCWAWLLVVVVVLPRIAKAQNCAMAHATLNILYWEDRGACSFDVLETDACPEECQALLDDVLSNCTPGDEVGDYNGFLTYSYTDVLLYNLYKFRHEQICNYGYTPTECDKALQDLQVARTPDADWLESSVTEVPRPVPAVCEDESYAGAPCPSECKVYIDAVVLLCDANVNATFAPPTDYFSLHEPVIVPVEWKSASSMELFGFKRLAFDPFSDNPLLDSCWGYYTDAAAAVNPNFESDLVPEFGSEACQTDTNYLLTDDKLFSIFDDLIEGNAAASACLFSETLESCVFDFSELELSNYTEACKKVGGRLITFDYSEKCEHLSSSGLNYPACVGSSCAATEACSYIAAQLTGEGRLCGVNVTNCSSSPLAPHNGSPSDSPSGGPTANLISCAVFLWILLA